MITPRHDYYPLTAKGQQEIPWFFRWWITPRKPPDKSVVFVYHMEQTSVYKFMPPLFQIHT